MAGEGTARRCQGAWRSWGAIERELSESRSPPLSKDQHMPVSALHLALSRGGSLPPVSGEDTPTPSHTLAHPHPRTPARPHTPRLLLPVLLVSPRL